jgi:hypothetical protein
MLLVAATIGAIVMFVPVTLAWSGSMGGFEVVIVVVAHETGLTRLSYQRIASNQLSSAEAWPTHLIQRTHRFRN